MVAHVMSEKGYIEFNVPNKNGDNMTIEAGFEGFPKAVLVPKIKTRSVKALGLNKKPTFGRAIWVLVNNAMEEIDLIAHINNS